MANVKFNRKEIEKEIKLDEKTLDRIMMLGIPVESFTEEYLEIQVLPNRPDLISMQGFLRAIKSFTGKSSGLAKYQVKKPESKYQVKVDASVNSVRPYTVCAIVKNLKLNDEGIKNIIDMQEKLHITLGRNRKKLALGIYPLDKISLPVRYEARKPHDIKFIPLEAQKEMSALEILQKHPAGREYAPLLENEKLFPVFVDARGKILSMPPIINSQETGRVTENTKEVFIECSGFDFNSLSKTLNIVVTSLADMGGTIYSMDIIYGKTKKFTTPNLQPQKMKTSLDNVNHTLGLNLKEKDLQKLLPRMGHDYSNSTVTIPAWRTDILHEMDIIEDVAIAYGYENLVPQMPSVSTIGEESKESKIKSRISEILAGLGMIEISTYHLIKDEEAKRIREEKIELQDSKTDYKFLRPSLIAPLLRTFKENKDNEYPQKLFEMGRVFLSDKKNQDSIKEDERLIVASSPANFTEIKQSLDYLIKMLHLDYSLKESKTPYTIDGRTGTIIINGKEIGFIGEIHPDTLRDWNIKMPIALFEISLEEIFRNINQ